MKILASWFRKNEFASLSGIMLAVGNMGALSAAGLNVRGSGLAAGLFHTGRSGWCGICDYSRPAF